MVCYSLFAVIFAMIFALLFASRIRSFTDIRVRISYRTSLHMLKNISVITYYIVFFLFAVMCLSMPTVFRYSSC